MGIKTPVSAKLSCLEYNNISHGLFISQDFCEVHIWDADRLGETLEILASRGITLRSVVKIEGETETEINNFYIIKF